MRQAPIFFPLILEGAQALMPLCKSWIHIEASSKTARVLILQESSGCTGLTGLGCCLHLSASSCRHGAHTGYTQGETAMSPCQRLVSTFAHVKGQPLCTSLERCNRKSREREGKPFPPCPQSASPSWKVTGDLTPASQTALNSDGNRAGRLAP